MADSGKARKYGAVAIALSVAALAILFMGAIALPKSIRFGRRSEQSEARQGTKSLFTCYMATFQETDTFVADSKVIGFMPERGNRYAWFLEETGPLQHRKLATNEEGAPDAGYAIIGHDAYRFPGEELTSAAMTRCPITPGKDPEGRWLRLGATPGKKGGFIALAARHLPDSVTGRSDSYDCWTIASMDRVTSEGKVIPAGEPFSETPDFR